MNSPVPILDYGPQVPWHCRRRLRRWIISFIALMLALGVWWFTRDWITDLRARWRTRAMINQCLNDSPPAGTIAFDDDPARSAPLLNTRHYLGKLGSEPYPQPPAANWALYTRAARCPESWYPIASQLHGGPRFGVYYDWALTLPRPDEPVLFLHSRTNSRGRTRLVVVRGSLRWRYGVQTVVEVDLFAESYHTDVAMGSLPELTSLVTSLKLVSPVRHDEPRLRIFAGQPDAADPSHFTIDYEVAGKRKTIEGWLKIPAGAVDGDHVELKIRQ